MMFKPRHGYKSPITHRYRGNAKGCPIFSKLDEITSDMVEDHDECLEFLARLKNRIDIYRSLVENHKPSNAVIKVSSMINIRLSYVTYCSLVKRIFNNYLFIESTKIVLIIIEQQIENVPSISHN